MPRLNLLSDENIAQILTYIRQNFNNNSSAVTLEDVSNTRKDLGEKLNKQTLETLMKLKCN